MSLYLDPLSDNSPFGFNKKSRIQGLQSFQNTLERHFFSQANLNVCPWEGKEILLAVELHCNMSLLEVLFHFNKGDWGTDVRLGKMVRDLSRENNQILDLEEFSIHLKDTSIVINRIYNQSITTQLKNLLRALGKHYVHFTKGLLEIPYEIFIPVFEDKTWNTEIGMPSSPVSVSTKKDYFGYWGIYYTSQIEAVIYDLHDQTLISGELHTLNR